VKKLAVITLLVVFTFSVISASGVLAYENGFKWQKPGANKFEGTPEEAMTEFNRLGIPREVTDQALQDFARGTCKAVTIKKGEEFLAMVSGKKIQKTQRFTLNQRVTTDWEMGVELTATECEADGYRFLRADICSNWLVVKAAPKAEAPPTPTPKSPEAVVPQPGPVMLITINVVWWHPALQAAPTIDSRDIDIIVRRGMRAGYIRPFTGQEIFDLRWLNSPFSPMTVATATVNRDGVWTNQATIAIRQEYVTRELVLISSPRSGFFLADDPSGTLSTTRVGEMRAFLDNWRVACGGNPSATACGTPEMVFHYVVPPPPIGEPMSEAPLVYSVPAYQPEPYAYRLPAYPQVYYGYGHRRESVQVYISITVKGGKHRRHR